MTIEVLFKEIYIYGDIFNVHYLEKALPNAKFIYTSFNQEPYFNKHKVDMIYMGAIPDVYQEKIVEQLIPFKNKLKEMIDANICFLITGNALDIFGKSIEEKNFKFKGLNLFDFTVKRDYDHRHNSWFIGKFKDISIIGNKSQFSFMYGSLKNHFIDITNGFGMNYEHKYEGIQYKNFYGTKLLGPFLIMNPLFTEYLFKTFGIRDKVIYKEELLNAYNSRIKHLQDSKSINFVETLVIRHEEK